MIGVHDGAGAPERRGLELGFAAHWWPIAGAFARLGRDLEPQPRTYGVLGIQGDAVGGLGLFIRTASMLAVVESDWNVGPLRSDQSNR